MEKVAANMGMQLELIDISQCEGLGWLSASCKRADGGEVPIARETNLWSAGHAAQATLHVTPPLATYEIGGLIYRPEVEKGMFTVFAPFTPTLWLAIVATTVAIDVYLTQGLRNLANIGWGKKGR